MHFQRRLVLSHSFHLRRSLGPFVDPSDPSEQDRGRTLRSFSEGPPSVLRVGVRQGVVGQGVMRNSVVGILLVGIRTGAGGNTGGHHACAQVVTQVVLPVDPVDPVRFVNDLVNSF